MRKIRNQKADDRPGPLALSLMSAAVIADLKADAAELSELYAELSKAERARLLALVFGSEV